MLIHSRTLSPFDVRDAARKVPTLRLFFVKTDNPFNVHLWGSSGDRPRGWYSDPSRDPNAFKPTWDEPRILLSILYEMDPNMKALGYRNARDFHLRTAHWFDIHPGDPHPHGRHRRHRWQDGFCRCGAANLSASDVDMLCPSV